VYMVEGAAVDSLGTTPVAAPMNDLTNRAEATRGVLPGVGTR